MKLFPEQKGSSCKRRKYFETNESPPPPPPTEERKARTLLYNIKRLCMKQLCLMICPLNIVQKNKKEQKGHALTDETRGIGIKKADFGPTSKWQHCLKAAIFLALFFFDHQGLSGVRKKPFRRDLRARPPYNARKQESKKQRPFFRRPFVKPWR